MDKDRPSSSSAILPRVKPDPIPAIHPVPEYAVERERAQLLGG
jgi:hypothetical protein